MLRDLKNENSLTDKSAVFLLFHGCYVKLLCMASVLRSMPDPDYLHYMPLLFVFFHDFKYFVVFLPTPLVISLHPTFTYLLVPKSPPFLL